SRGHVSLTSQYRITKHMSFPFLASPASPASPAAVAAAAALLALVPAAHAQSAASSAAQPVAHAGPDEVEDLERRLQADERRLRELERRLHQRQQSAPKASAAAQWGLKGLAISSADGSNILRLGALVQADGRYFADSAT